MSFKIYSCMFEPGVAEALTYRWGLDLAENYV